MNAGHLTGSQSERELLFEICLERIGLDWIGLDWLDGNTYSYRIFCIPLILFYFFLPRSNIHTNRYIVEIHTRPIIYDRYLGGKASKRSLPYEKANKRYT